MKIYNISSLWLLNHLQHMHPHEHQIQLCQMDQQALTKLHPKQELLGLSKLWTCSEIKTVLTMMLLKYSTKTHCFVNSTL